MAGEKTSILYTAEDRTRAASESVRQQILGIQKSLDGVASRARSFGDTFRSVIAGGLGVAVFKDIIDRTIESERTFAQLTVTLRATGHAAGETREEISTLVEELSKSTAFDDDDINKAAVALLRFRDVQKEVFEQALRLAPDLATALGTDLASAAQTLGRALEDPSTGVKGLRAAGFALSQTQKDLIEQFQEAGQTAKAQQVIIDALTKSIGGAAAGENQGLYGSVRGTAKAYDDLLKTIGRSKALQGFVQDALGGLTQIIKDFSDESDHGARKFRAFTADVLEGAAKIGGVTGLLARAAAALVAPAPQSQPVEGKIRGAVDPEATAAAVGKLQAEIDQANEAALARQKQRDKDQRLLAKVRIDALLQDERRLADQRSQILDTYHERGIISERAFYEARTAISKAATSAEIAAIDRAITEQQTALNRKGARALKPEERGGVQAELERLRAQRRDVEARGQFEVLKNTEAEADAQKKLADAIGEVNAQLFEQQQQQAQAASIRFEQANEQLRAQIRSNFGPDSGIEKRLDQLKQLTIANAQLKELQDKAGLERDRLATEEERIQNARRVGAIGELTALKQTDEARQASLSTLRALADEQEKVANATKDPAQLQAVQRLKAEIDALAASADLLGDKFRTIFEDTTTNAIDGFVSDLQRGVGAVEALNNAIKNFAQDLERSLAHIAAQNLAESLFGRGGSAAGAPGFVANLFGGGGGAAAGSGIADWFKKLFSSGAASGAAGAAVPGLASGGSFRVRGSSGTDTNMISFRATQGELVSVTPPGRAANDARGGDITVNAPITIYAPGGDANVIRRSQAQASADLARSLQRAAARA